LGTLIRHAAPQPTATIGALPVAMIQPSLDALLMTPICGAMLAVPRMTAALHAAISLAAIAARANPEHRPAIGVAAKPKPENNFPMNRHPRSLTAFDNSNGSCQGKNNSRLPSFLA
jgi:hypothetical protein